MIQIAGRTLAGGECFLSYSALGTRNSALGTPMHVRLVKSFGFESAHWLPTFPEGHKCRRMHGHSFMVEIVVEGDVPEEKGYLIDYGEIRTVIDPIQKRLDHRVLNEIPGLNNPTSEVLAKWIWDAIKPPLPILAEVIVHETCTSRCHYKG